MKTNQSYPWASVWSVLDSNCSFVWNRKIYTSLWWYLLYYCIKL